MNTGFLIDDSASDKGNPAHGGIVGCTFCHIGSPKNTGIAIAIKGLPNGYGFNISDCQIWYNSILIENSHGITFSGINFGRGLTKTQRTCATIDIDGGGLVMFTGCQFINDVSRPPEIRVRNNTKVRFTGCYGTGSGNEITENNIIPWTE